ncbi:hypothetical protein GBAR_LOCUS6174 [Geodia barretti]|uniref:Uncharacterized protein n=1 Tax=Geodia barretti TaxID=519541 RepID=A0AA35RDS2_GEOBA|nr:hypothetical protein GBAR_LOCUS6174 [Geodia barretti]
MNVVKKVANLVRRPSPAIFRSSGPSLLADPEREPFQYEIQQQALHYLMPGAQSTPEEKIQAVAKIGHMCWTGGMPASEFAAKNYFTLLANLLHSKEPSHAPLGLAGVVRGLELDWDGWEHNEARELIHLCQLNHLLN